MLTLKHALVNDGPWFTHPYHLILVAVCWPFTDTTPRGNGQRRRNIPVDPWLCSWRIRQEIRGVLLCTEWLTGKANSLSTHESITTRMAQWMKEDELCPCDSSLVHAAASKFQMNKFIRWTAAENQITTTIAWVTKKRPRTTHSHHVPVNMVSHPEKDEQWMRWT